MQQKINEKVNVLVGFREKKFKPLAFYWQNRKRKIEKINLTYTAKTGRHDFYYFSVTSAGDYYKFCFDVTKMTWTLEETSF
ncbi:hypothetical protein KKC60_04810 [Patescibacteria group bacterium]|nr:hypothetical protein [Patescibacteria group bacterium]